ncbi:hypothetical protein [Streptomyces griseoloalbus]|uniref:Uncharacterized protein n=1 Tax=Streptomyces griseoloalbus TaxID=67303 RepID=A0A7W8BWP8_9ACTN|nr:hypothetical protein [Streptomyces albaduncus]MBB5129806.1 hypothetical protein [Streptomyces albaduncus]GGW81017.1 hypothetical protein GCM10010340_68960 [Streptomyces albaduncus]
MRIEVTGEALTDDIEVTTGQQARVVQVSAGLVSSVNGQTGDVTGLATTADVSTIAAAVAGPVADEAADEAVTTHVEAADPHGDRAYADGQFLPVAGGTLTGPISGPGGFAVDSSGNVTAESLTLPDAATTLSKSLVITAPAGAVSYVVWRAPKACTVVGVRGYRVGGTGATINAQRGTADLLATDLSLSTADTWLSGPSLQNTTFAVGDSLTVAIRSVSGAPTAVTIQVDLQGA